MIQLTQVEIAQIVSNAVSQALTHQIQQLGNSLPSTTAANHVTQNTSAAQQSQPPIKFDVPAFEGDSTASWLTWSQRVSDQARASGFENELTAAVGDGLSVGADVFDSSNVDPVKLRNAHPAWMILINSCSGMALEIVQRSDAPNDAWRNLEFHYRAKGTREILRLSHEINGKTMEPGSDPFKFMMEVDRLAADLHRLGVKSVTELRKCVIIVSGLSADFEMECRILENNPAGLNRAEIERVVGNQYNRLLRQQQDSKALSASKGTVTANREKGKNRRLHHKFDGKCFNCGKKGHRAVDCRSAMKKSEKSGATNDRKEGGGSGRCYICVSEEHLAHRHCGLCKSLEHRTRDCEERGAEKGTMLAKLTVPVVAEVREVTAMVGAARSVRKEEWESDSGATFHMSHTRAGMSAYKKASPGTNVEIADGNILPVDGFGRIEVDLDQPGRTTKMVKMDDVAYVPGLSRNLLSTVKVVEQWGKPLIYYRNKPFWGSPGEESLVFKFCRRRGLLSATGARQIPRQEAAIEASLTENGLVKIASGAALRASASRGVMEVHRMLAHPSEDITRKTAVMMGIETTGQWGACETCFQVKAKRHAVPKKTDERASVRGQRFFVDVGRPMKHSSLGGNSYVVIFVDDCTRFKVVRFVKKRDTTATLLSLIADYITPQKLSIKCIRTDNGGEFEGEFQRKLDRRSITHEHTPPDTPQYNGVAERALGLLKEKAIILMEELDDVINVPREKLWAQAMLFACDVTNKSVTTSTDRGKSPYELWFGNFPTANHLRPFGAVGYARQSAREHKMAPKGEKCVFM